MKTLKLLFAGSGLLLTTALSGFTQSYDLSWFTIDGGGGTSTGGNYSLTGTIGQPDAGTLSGGSYTIAGGFWGVIAAMPSPGRPQLAVFVSGKNVTLSWPSPSTGFTLEENTTLNRATWSAVQQTITDNGTTKSITLSSPAGNKFYRLRH